MTMKSVELSSSISTVRHHDPKHPSQIPAFPSLPETLTISNNNIERNTSPSRASTHSNSSAGVSVSASASVTGSGPHFNLKRRDRSKHMRNLHSIEHPSFSPAINQNPNQTQTPRHQQQPAPLRFLQAQSHLSRSNTAPSPKRPPASHSSYGVETTVGPPPSFDTRRTLSTERVWRVDRSKSLRVTLGADRVEAHQQSAPVAAERDSTPLLDTSPDSADTQSLPTPTDVEDVTVMDVTVQGSGLGLSHSEAESKSSSGSHKSEDLFLNIARVDSGSRPSSSRAEKRKSRISLPFLSSNVRPATSHTPETVADSSVPTPRAELSSYHNKRASLQFAQPRGLVDQSSDNGSTEASNSGYFSKRSSNMYADTIRPVQRSATTLRQNRLVSEAGYLDKSKFGEQNTTESTTSTTAPSTVWDELDDLKSRIRKLELTGKLPPSSAAAMSSAERPRTATTAATTMSTSPKHKIPAQVAPSIEGVSPAVHPLLQEALGNAEAVVSHDVYQKLQNTAQDALQLASLTTYDANGRNSASAMTDRQIRRRTESLCRSLTELAIALSSEQKVSHTAVSYRPNSRDQHLSPAAGTFRSRAYSQSNEERMPPSVRVQSRLETRRVSTQLAYPSARHTTPELDSPTALPPYAHSGGRTTRVASTFRPRRPQPLGLDGSNDEEAHDPAIRPVSRAYTDLAAARRVSRDRTALSREYTSQHPMPSTTEMPPATRTPLPANLSTNFISRRKLASPTAQSNAPDSSPLASRQSWGRISIIQDNPPPSDTVSEAPGPDSRRSVSAKRSLGFGSRLVSVGSRLRAAKSERGYRDSSPPFVAAEGQ